MNVCKLVLLNGKLGVMRVVIDGMFSPSCAQNPCTRSFLVRFRMDVSKLVLLNGNLGVMRVVTSQ